MVQRSTYKEKLKVYNNFNENIKKEHINNPLRLREDFLDELELNKNTELSLGEGGVKTLLVGGETFQEHGR